MLTLRRFSDSDWDGFSGATPFSDDMDPLIGSFEIPAMDIERKDSEEYAVICDPSGLEIDCSDGICFRAKLGEEVNVLFQLTPFMTADKFGRLIENGLISKIN